MKKNISIIGLALTLGLASCSDYLDETNRNAVTADVLYSTPDGYENLVNACYAYTKAFMGNTDGYSLTEMGTDCFTGAGSSSGNVPALAYYGIDLNPTYKPFRYMWNILYSGLNCCNAAIGRADNAGLDASTKKSTSSVHFICTLSQRSGVMPSSIQRRFRHHRLQQPVRLKLISTNRYSTI